MTSDAIVPYLLQVGWEGNPHFVQASLQAELEYFESADLAIDVGTGARSRVGIEYRLNQRGQPPHETRWAGALQELRCGWTL